MHEQWLAFFISYLVTFYYSWNLLLDKTVFIFSLTNVAKLINNILPTLFIIPDSKIKES